MFTNYDDDANYEFNARYDYLREAYGDPCPACRTLRWQADCPKCYVEEPADPEIDEALGVALAERFEREQAVRRLAAERSEENFEDDIPF
jgi:hypothetical protein